jgi:hypothetical protein
MSPFVFPRDHRRTSVGLSVAADIGADHLVHEGEELDAAAAPGVAADDFADGDIERGERCRGAGCL